jgi:hypothetical protein
LEASYSSTEGLLRVTFQYGDNIDMSTAEKEIEPQLLSTPFQKIAATGVSMPYPSQNNQSLEYYTSTDYLLAKIT